MSGIIGYRSKSGVIRSKSSTDNLSDYEEGTWTPTATATGGSWTSTGGTYVKIGNIVTVQGELTKVTSGSNNSVGGWPFTNGGQRGFGIGKERNRTGHELVMMINVSATTGSMRLPDNGNSWSDGDICNFTVVYQTS